MNRNLLILLFGLVALTSTVLSVQPGCRTRYELRMKWAVQNQNELFWECPRWGVAVQRSCPTGTLFSSPYQTCVPTKAWEPFPYYAPPTTVNDWEDQCTEDLDVCVNPCEGCVGGEWINGVCECPEGQTLDQGVCKATGEIDGEDCGEHGTWNAIDGFCVCDDGYVLEDGTCVPKGPGLTIGVCDGASEEAHLVQGTMDCLPVDCTDDQYWPNTLFPTRNPRTFFQCANQLNVVEMPCGAGTCFDFKRQVCIHARDWVNQCTLG